jgi:hypothetical protein
MNRRGWLVALLLLLAAVPLRAQVRGDDRSRAAELAREVLARGSYLRIDRDTVLPATFAATGDVVIYDAEVRLEGSVAGSVVVIGGHLYLRPGSRVGGPIAVLDGGVYPSARSEHVAILEGNPSTRVAVTPGAARGDTTLAAEIVGPPFPSRVGISTSPYPTYDRVNGVTATVGGVFRLSPDERGGTVSAFASYRFRQENHVGGGVRLDLPLRFQSVRLTAEASRATRTNDVWLRNDFTNTISSVVLGNDYRDYYDADRASVFVNRPVAKPIIQGETWLGPRLGVQVERARSLDDLNPYSVLGDGLDRENPPVLEGTIVSAIAGAVFRWRTPTIQFDADGQVERGFGDASFTQATVWSDFYAATFRGQSMRIFARAMMPIATDAPPQRYGILGGSGTLPTLAIGQFRGDHLAYVTSEYLIASPYKIRVPYLGEPRLELVHATGAAWTGDMPRWEQNVGGGVRFFLARGGIMIDPVTGRTSFYAMLSAPRL